MAVLTQYQKQGIFNAALAPGNTVNDGISMGEIRRCRVELGDNAGANTATEVFAFSIDATNFPNGAIILAANLLPGTAIVGDDTDYDTFNVNIITAAAVAVTTASTKTSKTTGGTGSMTALNVYALTTTVGNAVVAAGNSVTVAKVVSGAGKAVSGATNLAPMVVEIIYQEL